MLELILDSVVLGQAKLSFIEHCVDRVKFDNK